MPVLVQASVCPEFTAGGKKFALEKKDGSRQEGLATAYAGFVELTEQSGLSGERGLTQVCLSVAAAFAADEQERQPGHAVPTSRAVAPAPRSSGIQAAFNDANPEGQG
jgi:hypothetical protein